MHILRDDGSQQVSRNELRGFCVAIFVVAAMIGVVLPALSRLPTVKQRVDSLKQFHINGNATFYTDQTALETFDPTESRR
jgi:hypothetical protein